MSEARWSALASGHMSAKIRSRSLFRPRQDQQTTDRQPKRGWARMASRVDDRAHLGFWRGQRKESASGSAARRRLRVDGQI